MKSVDTLFEEEGAAKEADFAEDEVDIGLEKGVGDYLVVVDEGDNIGFHLFDDLYFFGECGIMGVLFGLG